MYVKSELSFIINLIQSVSWN